MRVVVVGAGLGGLLSALSLAQRGHEVTVLERAAGAGGRAAAPQLGGVVMNSGPRALYRGGALARTLAAHGIRPIGHAPSTRQALAFADGALAPLPTSLIGLISSPLLEGGGRNQAARALARITTGALDVVHGEDTASWIARHAPAPSAGRLLAALVRLATYDHRLDVLDARRALLHLRAATARGVLYVDGGWQSIVDALLARAHVLGVEVRLGVRVAEWSARRVVLDGGDAIDAQAVVRATGRAGDDGDPVIASCLDVLFDELPQPQRRFVLGLDRPLYLSVHSAPGVAPVKVHVAVYGGGERAELEALLDVAQPGWRAHEKGARFLPRMVVQAARARPARVTDEHGVFVVEDGAGHALLADGVAERALAIADAVAALSRASVAA